MNASGGDVDVVNFIGKHECSKVPPSLFNEDGTMRAAGTKSSLVKILKEETEVTTSDLLTVNNKIQHLVQLAFTQVEVLMKKPRPC